MFTRCFGYSAAISGCSSAGSMVYQLLDTGGALAKNETSNFKKRQKTSKNVKKRLKTAKKRQKTSKTAKNVKKHQKTVKNCKNVKNNKNG